MSTKWPKGSAGEKEEKEHKVIALFVGCISVLVLMCLFVLDTDLKEAVKIASGWLNVVGGLMVAGSVVPIFRAFNAGEEGVKSYILWWGVLLALGICVSCGFWDGVY